MSSYGRQSKVIVPDLNNKHVRELVENGISIEKGYLSMQQVELFYSKLENILQLQENEFGLEQLEKIGEKNVVRAPLCYDQDCFQLIESEVIQDVARCFLGENYILHLQNAIFNKANEVHHQSAWHRDLPYQNHRISRPLALNAFICLTQFNALNGATQFIKGSHNMEDFPDNELMEENATTLNAEAGDLIFFDSMIIHRAGKNKSELDRVGVNHVLVKPLLKQQIDLTSFFNQEDFENGIRRKLIGFDFSVAKSVSEFRENRAQKQLKHE